MRDDTINSTSSLWRLLLMNIEAPCSKPEQQCPAIRHICPSRWQDGCDLALQEELPASHLSNHPPTGRIRHRAHLHSPMDWVRSPRHIPGGQSSLFAASSQSFSRNPAGKLTVAGSQGSESARLRSDDSASSYLPGHRPGFLSPSAHSAHFFVPGSGETQAGLTIPRLPSSFALPTSNPPLSARSPGAGVETARRLDSQVEKIVAFGPIRMLWSRRGRQSRCSHSRPDTKTPRASARFRRPEDLAPARVRPSALCNTLPSSL
jgi:hypothetical protein